MRLFVAVRVPDPAADELLAALGPLRVLAPELRWVGQDRLHLTLAFLGRVPGSREEDLRARLERAAGRHPPPVLRISGAGRFGDRVLFARPAGDLDGLRRLAASVRAAARRTGLPQEERTWRPHVTLARSPQGADRADLRPVAEGLAGYEGSRWTADRIHLVGSVPASEPRRPPRYVDVGTWPLTGRS